MSLKKRAIPLPDLAGKTVLDIGCDHGWWCWDAINLGAEYVLGIDRNREVNGRHVDLIERNKLEAERRSVRCRFMKYNIGKQWPELGRFDVAFLFSLYHHVYQNCADHAAVWYWLSRHVRDQVIWENPTGTDDPVVRMNVRYRYDRQEILDAAERYFNVEVIGPAIHEPTREVWRCTLKLPERISWNAAMRIGSGGSARAFEYAAGRRITEIDHILGVKCVPGSLNVKTDRPFEWNARYYRAQVLDPVDRSNLDSEWRPRWARLYPIEANCVPCFAFRFEGEQYKDSAVELISYVKLRDVLPPDFRLYG